MFRHLIAVLAFLCIMPFARASDPLGHMLTMRIAYGELTPKARGVGRGDRAVHHQPLHATEHSDTGGNRTKISNLRDAGVDLLFSKGGNLHFFWDSACRREFKDGQVGASRDCAEKRITLAGYRIAALLNRLLDPSRK
ncbi:MAG: hypothetical protein NTV93_00825 [Verrucomicrobia bacterium]|nr:hypothetical protein [Verrucomicrobiota bacterium]